MPLTDFFDSSEEEVVEEPEQVKTEPKESKIDATEFATNIADLIGSVTHMTPEEKSEFSRQFGYWGALLLSIVGFEDLAGLLKYAKPLPLGAKLGIVIGGFALLFIVLRPKHPKQNTEVAETVQLAQQQPPTASVPINPDYAKPAEHVVTNYQPPVQEQSQESNVSEQKEETL